eukprot:RCo039802
MKFDLNQPIVYCDDWAVGIPLIDAQHLRLFEMIEDLRLAVVTKANPAVVTKVLKGLVEYCGDHFECEQMLMQRIKYPTLGSHMAIHQRFTDQTLQWFTEHQKGTLNPVDVIEALLEWLVSHILENDKKIAVCCHEKGISCEQFVSVSDVIVTDEEGSAHCSCRPSLEVGMLLVFLPMLALFCWFAFYQATGMSLIVSAVGTAVFAALFGLCVVFVRATLHAETRQLHLAHAKQLADNMLASEIAKHVAVMDVENVD